ncbi:amidase [Oceaniglobus roseus]|uniref:amidase n=1 Tax=Oceaniglobus roseus TaxID=1737570 RepID=UPI000C7F1315|nr:amidase [Kandeliimicrobium roseum]
MIRHPADLSLAEAGARLRDGTLTATALVTAQLERIAERDPRIGAFVHLAREEALDAAALADRQMADGDELGPLHGIPFAVKDLMDVAGCPVRFGSRLHGARIAAADCTLVARLRAAGAIPLGLVATYELATVGPDTGALYPQPVNPWNAAHVTGGSSSGSAAAVAAGMVRFALGTDTGGSVRSPAAYCGVVGLKPSFGALPLDDVMPLSPTLDHAGVIARTVGDAATAFAVLAGRDRAEPGGIAGLALAYGRGWAGDDAADGALVPLLDEAASALSLCGAAVRIVDLPDYAPLEAAGSDLILSEGYLLHGAAIAVDPAACGPMARASLAGGADIPPGRIESARAAAADLRHLVDALLTEHAALILPTTLTPAPPFAAFQPGKPLWTPMRTIPFNLTGHPAISVPMGFAGGLPLGLQIVGRHGDEATVLSIAAAFEAATDHGAVQPAGC